MDQTTRNLAVATALLAAVGCGEEETNSSNEIVLGALVDQTGAAGPGTWEAAITLAANQTNQALAASGSDIRFNLIVRESANVPEVAVERAVELVQRDGAKGLVVDTSQDTLAVASLQYEEDESRHLDVPIVSLVATSPLFGNPNAEHPDPLSQTTFRDPEGWDFRTSMSSASQGVVLSRIVDAIGGDVNQDGTLKISAFVSDEPFGLGQLNTLNAGMATLFPEAVIESVLFKPSDRSPNDLAYFAEALALLGDEHNETTGQDDGPPDVLLGFSFPDYLAAIIKAYNQAGATTRFVHGVALRNQTIIDSLGSEANGQEGAAFVVVAPGPSGETFARDMEALLGSPPNSLDSASYDAAASLMLAALIAARDLVDPAALTGAQIRDAMRKTSEASGEIVRPGVEGLTSAVQLILRGEAINYEGAQGPCDFDEQGSTRNNLVHFVIEDRTFQDRQIYDCISDPSCPAL